MPQVLNYASPEPRQWHVGRRILATLPLTLGLFGYAMLCMPTAMPNHDWSMNHFYWRAATYLWTLPVPLFVLCWPAGRFSKVALILYAIISGYADACTIYLLTPDQLHHHGTLFNCVFMIPIHIAGVGGIAWISRFAIARFGWHLVGELSPRQKTARAAIFIAIALIGIIFPSAYSSVALYRLEKEGRNRADGDWAAHSVVLCNMYGWRPPHQLGQVTIQSEFDARTGFLLTVFMNEGYEDAYWRRILELIETNGIPSWSKKSRLVSDSEMVSLLNTSTMQPVTEFPYDAAPGITLFRDGAITRWGTTTTAISKELTIASRFSVAGPQQDAGAVDTAYVGRFEKYPGMVFVRYGHEWIAACTDDGWILEYASKSWPRQ